jgi:hypothetical protein
MESWAIIAIVAILASFVGNIYTRTLKSRSAAGSRVDGELADIRDRLGKIEEMLVKRDVVQRLNALEAIVTDKRFDLNRQINGLGND